MERKILSVRDYGHVTLRLQELLEARGLKRNQVASAMGVRFEVVDKWYKGEISRLDTDILARLCYVLECDVSDILSYENK